MLWYKTWLETRWRFVIGVVVLMCSACGVVFSYPQVVKIMSQMPAIEWQGEIGRRIRESAELSREYRGYVWSNGFAQNLAQMGTLFAVLLGTGGLVAPGAGLFTLSLPASRNRLLAVRAAAGLAQWLALALFSALLIPLLSPAIGESYSVGSALVHGGCLFVAGAAFFSLALLLSTIFGDLWRPLLVALAIATLLGVSEQLVQGLGRHGLFGVMSGEAYFRTGRLPWLGLLASVALSAAMLFGAARHLARRDF